MRRGLKLPAYPRYTRKTLSPPGDSMGGGLEARGIHVIVKLMDSGETVTININEIKHLDERFTELPIQVSF